MCVESLELVVLDRKGASRYGAVDNCVKPWIHWSQLGTFSCRYSTNQNDSLLVCCFKNASYVRAMSATCFWMSEWPYFSKTGRPDFFALKKRYDQLCFIAQHEYWTGDCNCELHVRTSQTGFLPLAYRRAVCHPCATSFWSVRCCAEVVDTMWDKWPAIGSLLFGDCPIQNPCPVVARQWTWQRLERCIVGILYLFWDVPSGDCNVWLMAV